VLAVAVRLLGAPLLRLCIGRWPTQTERMQFATGFVSGERIVPPILRGLHAVPAAKEPLGQLAVLNLVREGVVRKPPDYGPHRMPMPPFPGNPLSYWRGDNLAFLHFEKTAGLSFASVLTDLFHPVQIDDDPERATAPHILSAFPACARERIAVTKLVWGHYDLPALRRLDPARPVLTILREPKARILSLYYFWRSVDPALVAGGSVNFNVAAAHELGLLGFLQSQDPLIQNYIDNVYVRRLTGDYAISAAEDRLVQDPDGCTRDALAELRTLAFVGLVEHMDESLAALSKRLSAYMPAHLPNRNARINNQAGAAPGYVPVAKEELTQAVMQELSRLTRLDEMIYQEALFRHRSGHGVLF
jgi:hypothetical protein